MAKIMDQVKKARLQMKELFNSNCRDAVFPEYASLVHRKKELEKELQEVSQAIELMEVKYS